MDSIALNFVHLLEHVNCVNIYRIMVSDSFQTKKDEDFRTSLSEHDGDDEWMLSDVGKFDVVDSG